MLKPDQITFYRDQGYLVVEDVFTATELAELNAVTDNYVEGSRAVTDSDNVYDLGPGHSANAPRVRRIKDPADQHDVYYKASRNPKLVALLQCLLGPDVRFDHSKLNIKPVGGGAAIEWHQDWAFYPYTNDDLLAVGLYLEDCNEDNGPLLVLPGSHRGPVIDHHHDGIFVGACDPGAIEQDLNEAVPLTGKAGSITIHHVRTLHASTENRGVRERRLLLFSYAAVDAWPLVDSYELDEFNGRIITGMPTFAPRQTAVPIRLPLPKPNRAGSIFENQEAVAGRSFAET